MLADAADDQDVVATTRAGPVVVLVYDGVGADETGVLVEILATGGLDVIITSVGRANVTAYHGEVTPTVRVADLHGCSALIVPGGMGVRRASRDEGLRSAIAELAESATWLCATSTGSVLLAAAGVIEGARATTHWLAGDLAASEGLTLVDEPFVEHGRLLTASGVASSVSLSFRLVGALAGTKAEQEVRAIYQPPRDGGDRRFGRKRVSWWHHLWHRKQVSADVNPLDPNDQAEMVVLDLDDLQR